jgi:hypothetical protein
MHLIGNKPQITFLAVDGDGQIWMPENGQIVRLLINN